MRAGHGGAAGGPTDHAAALCPSQPALGWPRDAGQEADLSPLPSSRVASEQTEQLVFGGVSASSSTSPL